MVSLTKAVLFALGCSVSGQSAQSSLEVRTLNQNSNPVRYSVAAMNSLYFTYTSVNKEFPLCLRGSEKPDYWFVEHVDIPFIYENSDSTTRFESLSCHQYSDFIGMAHNHLRGECRMSSMDYNRFTSDLRAKIEIIVCNVDNPDQMNVNVFFKYPKPGTSPGGDSNG